MEIENIKRLNNTKTISLTPKEKKVLEFIEFYIQENGLSPTFSEIKEHFQFASFNSVQRYLKQLQKKQYIHMPGGNQKRALTVLKPSDSIVQQLKKKHLLTEQSQSQTLNFPSFEQDGLIHKPTHIAKGTSIGVPPHLESLSLPLLGKVAAGRPIESIEHDAYVDVPPSLLRSPATSFALVVSGDSMIDDGIFDGDTILVQKQNYANNGEIVVALIENEATVKRIYFESRNHKKSHLSLKTYSPEDLEESDGELSHDMAQIPKKPQVELRPSNSNMNTMWFDADLVKIEGVVVGLIRKF